MTFHFSRFERHLPRDWAGLCLLAAARPARAEPVDIWLLGPVENTTLLWLSLGLAAAILLGIAMYRLTVKSQMAKGVHPHHVGLSLMLLVAGCFLVYSYFILSEAVLGMGYFAVIAGVYLLVVLVLLMLGKVTRWLVYFLLLVGLLAGFRYLVTTL